MTRWFAGTAAVLLIVAGAFFALQGQAVESSMPPDSWATETQAMVMPAATSAATRSRRVII